MGGLEKTAMIITARYRFRASHSLEAPEHRKADIGELCGILHGHEYLVEVSLKSALPDPITGLSSTRAALTQLKEKVFKPLKNIHLNDHFQFTSGEFLCRTIFKTCQEVLPKEQVINVALQETSKNRFEVTLKNQEGGRPRLTQPEQ